MDGQIPTTEERGGVFVGGDWVSIDLAVFIEKQEGTMLDVTLLTLIRFIVGESLGPEVPLCLLFTPC